MGITQILATAVQRAVVQRALLVAGVAGTVLIGINHGNTLVCGEADAVCLSRCGLTYLVPYCVSTVTSVLAEANRLKLEAGVPAEEDSEG